MGYTGRFPRRDAPPQDTPGARATSPQPGFSRTHRLHAWERFLDLGFWWMHAMVLVWLRSTVVLFIAEPLFLHAWFRRRAAALGAHGALFRH